MWQSSASRHGRLYGLKRFSRSYYGMVLGHVGLAMTMAGATMVSMHGVEQDRRMAPGDRVEVAGFEWHFADLGEREGRISRLNGRALTSTVTVTSWPRFSPKSAIIRCG